MPPRHSRSLVSAASQAFHRAGPDGAARRTLVTASQSPRDLAADNPVGGFRGTLNGFLLGFGLVSAGGAAWVLQSQRQAAETVSATAAQLQRDTATLAEHMDKVHRLETELAVLKGVSIPRSEQQGRKDALEQLYQGVREDLDTAVTRLSHVEKDVESAMARIPKEALSDAPRRIV